MIRLIFHLSLHSPIINPAVIPSVECLISTACFYPIVVALL